MDIEKIANKANYSICKQTNGRDRIYCEWKAGMKRKDDMIKIADMLRELDIPFSAAVKTTRKYSILVRDRKAIKKLVGLANKKGRFKKPQLIEILNRQEVI